MRTYDSNYGEPCDLTLLLEKVEQPGMTFNHLWDDEKTIVGHCLAITESERIRLIELLKVALS